MLLESFIIFYFGTIAKTVITTSSILQPETTRKIIGGQQCSVEKYPFMISLRRLSSLTHFCAGTLITPDWVLTAGHCLASHVTEPNLFTAIAGVSQLDQLGVQRRRFKQIFVHPDFDDNNYDNDVSLVFLEHSFLITAVVKPISIPNQVIHGDLYTVCPEGIAIGWGWHNESEVHHLENGTIPHVPVLQCVVDLPVLTDQQCQNARAGMHLRPNTFCTMVQTRENLCQGDSGGPLFCSDVQYGIVSSGFTCKFPSDTPGYYTRIDRVLNFIKESISGQVSFHRLAEMENESLDNKPNSLVYMMCSFLFRIFLNTMFPF